MFCFMILYIVILLLFRKVYFDCLCNLSSKPYVTFYKIYSNYVFINNILKKICNINKTFKTRHLINIKLKASHNKINQYSRHFKLYTSTSTAQMSIETRASGYTYSGVNIRHSRTAYKVLSESSRTW